MILLEFSDIRTLSENGIDVWRVNNLEKKKKHAFQIPSFPGEGLKISFLCLMKSKFLSAVYKEPRLYICVLFNLCLPKYLDSYKNWLLHEYARKSNESDSLIIVYPP